MQVAVDAFGNALGSSLASSNSSNQSSAGEQVLSSAQAQAGGYDSDAAYAHLADAFSQPNNGYNGLSSPMLASGNGIVSDAMSPEEWAWKSAVESRAGAGLHDYGVLPGVTVKATRDEFGVSSVDPATGAITWNTGAVSYPVAEPSVMGIPLPESGSSGVGYLNRLGQSFLGTAQGAGTFALDAARFVNDQGWALANGVTGGWLADNVDAAQAAVQRNTALGQAIANAPGAVASFGLRAMTGNVSVSEIGQGISQAWQSERINQLEAAGDIAGAQALRTQNVLTLASLAVGGEGVVA